MVLTRRNKQGLTESAALVVRKLGGRLIIDEQWHEWADAYLAEPRNEQGLTHDEEEARWQNTQTGSEEESNACLQSMLDTSPPGTRDNILEIIRRAKEYQEPYRRDPHFVHPGHVQQHIKMLRASSHESDEGGRECDEEAWERESDRQELKLFIEELADEAIVKLRGPKWPQASFDDIESAMKYYLIGEREIFKRG